MVDKWEELPYSNHKFCKPVRKSSKLKGISQRAAGGGMAV